LPKLKVAKNVLQALLKNLYFWKLEALVWACMIRKWHLLLFHLQKGKIARNWSLKSRKCMGNFISVI